MTHRRYFLTLSCLFLIIWVGLAIQPYDRADWALENVLVVFAALVLAGMYRNFPLSRISYTAIFIFISIHTVGSHYTYANVPYDAWFASLTGSTLNELMGWERNNFDRVIHLLYGLLLAYPIREVFLRVVNVRGFWGYFLPLDLTMSTSMLFELFEWIAAEVFGGELGMAYLGTQGDVWDAHKDMALASLGALITMASLALFNSHFQRDFALEWSESLRVKNTHPLGEDALEQLLADHDDDRGKAKS